MDFDDSDAAFNLISHYVNGMVRVAECQSGQVNSDISPVKSESIQKQMFGDSWSFFYGVKMAQIKIKEGRTRNGDVGEDEVYDLTEFDDHCETFGYGAYREGLAFGKRLFFWSDTDFSFDSASSNDEYDFTFTE